MKNIAIVYICTGKYSIYWKDFYETAEKNLFVDEQKTYYVFTDCESLEYKDNKNVVVVPQQRLGFFYDTLMRFHMFLEIEDKLKTHDYVYFINSNYLINLPISFDELDPEDNILAVEHPGYLGKAPNALDYERNPISEAFIPVGVGSKYYMGGMYGGKTLQFLKLCRTCFNTINADLVKEYVAKWHDESHTNKYFLQNPPKVVSSKIYGWPEGWGTDAVPKITVRNKANEGDHAALRGMDTPVKIVLIMGGLANQMFQYAFYLKLKKHHKNVRISISNLKHGKWPFILSHMFKVNFKDVFLYEKFLNTFPCKTISENGANYGYKPEVITDPDSAYYYGFWQCEKYFVDIKDEILEAFKFPPITDPVNFVYAEEMKCTNSVSIHVRRGDYLQYPLHNVTTPLYYANAVQYIKNTVKDPVFFVFSDDIEFCRTAFKGDNFYFIDHNKGNDSYRDMQLMSMCKHNIVANSSFSWWGAWLNQNKGKIVIGPNKHFNDPNYKDPDIYLDDWVRIPC